MQEDSESFATTVPARNFPESPENSIPTGLVFNIMRFSVLDGPGIRTTVFLKGCPLRCRWCHNPESQSAEPEVIYFGDRCIRCGDCVRACPQAALRLNGSVVCDLTRCRNCGDCTNACPVTARQLAGRRMSVGQVVAEVAKDQVFFDESGGGITLSGGEPLMQPRFVELLLAAVKARGIGTVLETCGFADPGLMRRLSRYVDLFLYDLKLVDSNKHRQFTGVPNEVILGNLKMLAGQGCTITVRVPLIPGVNDDSKNVSALSEFLSSVGLRDIDLLPYHRTGSSKYDRLHMSDRMMTVEPPSADQMEALAARLRRGGFRVRIGG